MEPRIRTYAFEYKYQELSRATTKYHPLHDSAKVNAAAKVPGGGNARNIVSRDKNEAQEGLEMKTPIDDPLGASTFEDPLLVQPGKANQASGDGGPWHSSQVPEHQMSPPTSLGRDRRRKHQGVMDERNEVAMASWAARKGALVQRFASANTISVTMNLDILPVDPRGRSRVGAARLEGLEDPEGRTREQGKLMSQQECVQRLRELDREISTAWAGQERVTALRLAIKVAKLLSDTSVPQFYPTLFVLVTDVMDTVGRLVWERIRQKAETRDSGEALPPLPSDFSCDDVRQDAKDTCQNWFLKIASIRDLLPRLYLEMSIVRCLQFLIPPERQVATFQRLAASMRGLGDPLAAGYARMYLARRGLATLPLNSGVPPGSPLRSFADGFAHFGTAVSSDMPPNPRAYLLMMLEDFDLQHRRVVQGAFDRQLAASGTSCPQYLALLEPPIEFLVECLLKEASQTVRVHFLERLDRQLSGTQPAGSPQRGPPVAILVHHVLRQMSASQVASSALICARLARGAVDESLHQSANFRVLGEKLCQVAPPQEQRLPILNETWKLASKYPELEHYLAVADVFVEFVLKLFTRVELNVLLRDVARHLAKVPELTQRHLAALEPLVFKLVEFHDDLADVLSLEHFVSLVEAFHGDMRTSVQKRLLAVAARRDRWVRDPLVVTVLLDMAKDCHDNLQGLAGGDDRRHLSRLLVRFIQQVDFGRQLEEHLSFLVNCRAALFSLDSVQETLIRVAVRLALIVLRATSGGSMTKRAAEFVRACLAFAEVAIPSLPSILPRLHLYLEAAEVALLNALPAHAEALLEGGIRCLQEAQPKEGEVPAEVATPEGEAALISWIQKLAAFLVVFPGDPEQGPFYLLNSLLAVLPTHPWRTPGRGKVEVYLSLLVLTATLSQKDLPYHVDHPQVDSNDILYFGEASYRDDVAALLRTLMEQLMAALESIPRTPQQARLALRACDTIATFFEANEEAGAICSQLFQGASQHLPNADPHLVCVRTICIQKGFRL